MRRIFSVLALSALMVAMMAAYAMPSFAASDNASCVGHYASDLNSFRPGLGGAAIGQLAHFGLVADLARANKEECPPILIPLR